MDWIDVTVAIEAGMTVWPGDEPVRVWQTESISAGAECNVGAVSMTLHAGTHVDAPAHFIDGAATIDMAPMDVFVGPARVVEIHDQARISLAELKRNHIKSGERILFKTPNSHQCRGTNTFWRDYVHLELEAANYLVECGVKLVGIDTCSVGGYYHHDREVHIALLSANIWIVENLNLDAVPPGEYEMICLPLKITRADASPARVLLRSY